MTKISPAAEYSVARSVNALVLTAGMTPRVDGVLLATGLIGEQLTAEDGRQLTAIATTRALDAVRSTLTPELVISSVVSLSVYIAAAPTFTELSYVADAATQTIREAFPTASLPVRVAVGVAVLPGGAPVEVQLTANVERIQL